MSKVHTYALQARLQADNTTDILSHSPAQWLSPSNGDDAAMPQAITTGTKHVTHTDLPGRDMTSKHMHVSQQV